MTRTKRKGLRLLPEEQAQLEWLREDGYGATESEVQRRAIREAYERRIEMPVNRKELYKRAQQLGYRIVGDSRRGHYQVFRLHEDGRAESQPVAECDGLTELADFVDEHEVETIEDTMRDPGDAYPPPPPS